MISKKKRHRKKWKMSYLSIVQSLVDIRHIAWSVLDFILVNLIVARDASSKFGIIKRFSLKCMVSILKNICTWIHFPLCLFVTLFLSFDDRACIVFINVDLRSRAAGFGARSRPFASCFFRSRFGSFCRSSTFFSLGRGG